MTKKTKGKELPRRPYNIDSHTWYYIEPKGIILVAEFYQDGKWQGTRQILITWAKMRNAIKYQLKSKSQQAN